MRLSFRPPTAPLTSTAPSPEPGLWAVAQALPEWPPAVAIETCWPLRLSSLAFTNRRRGAERFRTPRRGFQALLTLHFAPAHLGCNVLFLISAVRRAPTRDVTCPKQHVSTDLLETSTSHPWCILYSLTLEYLPRLQNLAANTSGSSAACMHRMGSTRPTRMEMGKAMGVMAAAAAAAATTLAMGQVKGSLLPKASPHRWQMYSNRLVPHQVTV